MTPCRIYATHTGVRSSGSEEVGKAGGQSQAGTSEFVEIREVVARYDCLLHGGELVRVDGKPAMKISNDNATALQIQLLKIQKPPFTRKRYAIIGEIKYEDVHGNGYLEMWNYFRPSKPGMPEGAYFSRTLGDSGESGKLSGTSNWRRFKLPFDSTGTKESLDRLELNLILPAQGTVYIRAVELIE